MHANRRESNMQPDSGKNSFQMKSKYAARWRPNYLWNQDKTCMCVDDWKSNKNVGACAIKRGEIANRLLKF